MDGTILSQGTFTVAANVPTVNIAIPSNADIMRVLNYTAAGRVGAGVGVFTNTGVEFWWQRGMATGAGTVKWYTGASTVVNQDVFTTGGFTLLDTSIQTPGAAFAITGISAANPPVVTSATIPALGSVVRLVGLDNQPQFGGMDFTVTAVAGGNFTIGNIQSIATTPSTVGFWRSIPFDPIYYPRKRRITYVRNAAQAVIYLSVTHQFAVGQKVRLRFPNEARTGGGTMWGDFAALDGVDCTITAVNVPRLGGSPEPTNALGDNNIQVNVDTTGFAAWNASFITATAAYPLANQVPFTPASVIPEGEDTGISLTSPLAQIPLDVTGQPIVGAQNGLLSDATSNLAYVGMNLGIGGQVVRSATNFASGPAGSIAGDVIYWWAGKSTLGGL
jgi:hypothetical protein